MRPRRHSRRDLKRSLHREIVIFTPGRVHLIESEGLIGLAYSMADQLKNGILFSGKGARAGADGSRSIMMMSRCDPLGLQARTINPIKFRVGLMRFTATPSVIVTAAGIVRVTVSQV